MPARSASVSRARGAQEGGVGVSVNLRLHQEIFFRQIHPHRSHTDLFGFDGGDNCRMEHECIEPQRWIGVFYPMEPYLFRTALCFINDFCWSGALQGWSSSLDFGLLAGTFV